MPSALVPLATTTLSAQAYTVVFNSISASYRDLYVTLTGTASTPANMTIYLNSDFTTSNYPAVYMGGDGSSASSGTLNGYVGGVYGSNLTTNAITIFDYAQTNKHKTYMSRLAAPSGASSLIVGRWANTSVVNSIQFSLGGNPFLTGTTINLYGVLA